MADALEALTADGTGNGANRRTGRRADISIVQHLSADGTRDFAEIAGGAVIPQSVLEEHMCNARVTGIVFSDKGVPLWHGHTKTIATEAQFRALIAKYGGCAGCGAPPLLCQAHHIKPVSQGGATDITNMIPLCWHCLSDWVFGGLGFWGCCGGVGFYDRVFGGFGVGLRFGFGVVGLRLGHCGCGVGFFRVSGSRGGVGWFDIRVLGLGISRRRQRCKGCHGSRGRVR